VSALPALCALASCGKTIDSVGYNGVTGVPGVHLNKVVGPATYPNPFKDLGKTDAEIAVKIADAFQKLFTAIRTCRRSTS
jgi:hypothetical protein